MANTRPKIIYPVNEDLVGIRDGINTEFTTTNPFIDSDTMDIHIEIFKSGVKQKVNDDYFIVDSGTPYDTVKFKRPPRQLEHLTCIYLPYKKGV